MAKQQKPERLYVLLKAPLSREAWDGEKWNSDKKAAKTYTLTQLTQLTGKHPGSCGTLAAFFLT